MESLDFQNKLIEILNPCIQNFEQSLKKESEAIYHYTSQNALKGILKSNQLWISHAFDMNDPDEILFGIDVIIHILSEIPTKNSIVLEWIKEEKEEFINYRESFFGTEPVFVFSLTEKGNDVNQWMHYGEEVRGCQLSSIGHSSEMW